MVKWEHRKSSAFVFETKLAQTTLKWLYCLISLHRPMRLLSNLIKQYIYGVFRVAIYRINFVETVLLLLV